MKGSDIVKRFDALASQRKTLDRVLQDIERYVVPYRGEFYRPMTSEHEVDWQRKNIYDNTAGVAANLLASQMHGNLTSPVTKWFSLRFRDEDLNTDQAAMEWLEDGEDKVWQTLQESNFDTVAPEVFLDSDSFGTAIVMMEDEDDLVWKGVTFNSLPLMESYFEAGPDGKPYRLYRNLKYTKLELDDTFDLPKALKPKDREDTSVDEKVEVVFCVYKEPANDSDKPVLAPSLRPWQWRYVHKPTGKILKKKDSGLSEGGYYERPGMTVRWQKTAGAKWGFSPAMMMISDIKQLNELVAMTSEATAKAIDPPMMTTEMGVIGDLDNVPGGLTLTSDMNDLQPLLPPTQFMSAYEERDRAQASIRAGFFVDKLELKDSPAMTATEAQIRYERMLRLLAPTLGRMKTDFLQPVVEGVFMKLLRAGQLDEPPESVADAEMDVEFTGPMPRAMKGEIADGMERWLLGIFQQVEINPDVLDIVDFDQFNRTMAKQRGVPAEVTKSDKEVEEVRKTRAAEQEEMKKAALAQQAGDAMKAVGEGGQAIQDAGMEPEQLQ